MSTSSTWIVPGLNESGSEARILNAALRCFARHGLSRTTMSDIAEAAELSRTSLYKHYPNREAVFRALVARVNQGVRRAVVDAAATPGGLAERLHAVASARVAWAFDALRLSEHGHELIDAKDELCGASTRETETEFIALLARIIAAAGPTATSPKKAAEILAKCLPGLVADERSEQDARDAVADFVRIFARGLTDLDPDRPASIGAGAELPSPYSGEVGA